MITKPLVGRATTVEDLQTAVQIAFDKLVLQINKPVDPKLSAKGNKITAVADPSNPTDAVNLQTLQNAIGDLGTKDLNSVKRQLKIINATLISAVTYSDTHANRLTNYPAVSYAVGATFYETDRHMFYICQNVLGALAWVYLTGEYIALYASLPTDLVATDTGFIFTASDACHSWVWQGSSWLFHPNDFGTGMIVAGSPGHGMWALCDGGTAIAFTSAAGTATITTPDLTGDVFIQGGASGRQTGTAPTWVSTAVTETAGTHTHTTPGATTSTGSGSTFLAKVDAAGTLVNATDHTHVVPSGVSGVDGNHSHALGTNAKINIPSEANGGLPLRIGMLWYYRL